MESPCRAARKQERQLSVGHRFKPDREWPWRGRCSPFANGWRPSTRSRPSIRAAFFVLHIKPGRGTDGGKAVRLREAVESGHFAITAEVGPPKGTALAAMLEDAETIWGQVDAINVTDQQSAVMRLGS